MNTLYVYTLLVPVLLHEAVHNTKGESAPPPKATKITLCAQVREHPCVAALSCLASAANTRRTHTVGVRSGRHAPRTNLAGS